MGKYKYSRKHLEHIQAMIQEQTGVDVATGRRRMENKIRQMALLAGCFLCFVILSAFAYAKFSDLNGDQVDFALAYQGDGRFEIVVVNSSDRKLELQDQVKLMQWSTGEEVEGESGKIQITGRTIEPHSQGILSLDISAGYDVKKMEENLQEGDWYYFVLTNHDFAFGQDWMCSFDFEVQETGEAAKWLAETMEQKAKEQEKKAQAEEQQYGTGSLIYETWSWPTVSRKVSAFYGEPMNGGYLDHINIAGAAGDDVYAAADGVITEAAFEAADGNVIIVDVGEGILVKYGHLEEIEVSAGDQVQQGQVIGTLGQSGMATGPNLLFAVIVDGEEIDPLM